jgi:hypothetical protein
MKRALSWVGLVLWIGAAACGGDDDTAAASQDGGSSKVDDASVAPAKGKPASGSTECPEYEPLSDAIARYEGNWLIDDADHNSSCPDASLIVLEGYPEQGLPPDPELNKTCPVPSALYMISNTAVKDCRPQPYCSSAAVTQAFFVHAWTKAALKGRARDDLFTNEKIFVHSDNEWSEQGEHIMVYLGKTQAEDTMNPGGAGVINYKRTGMARGDCMRR